MQGPHDILVRITVRNRGTTEASLHVLPTLWFRNTWWSGGGGEKPFLRKTEGPSGTGVIAASHPDLGERYLYCEGAPDLLFTENETNTERLFGTPTASPFVKDGINDYIVEGRSGAVNPEGAGTKASTHYRVALGPGEERSIRLRLNGVAPSSRGIQVFGSAFEDTFSQRVLVLAYPLYSAVLIPTVFAIIIGVEGRLVIGAVYMVQGFSGAAWGTGIPGILSIIFGLVLIVNPLVTAVGLVLLFAGFAIVGGIAAIIFAFRMPG